MGIFQNFNAKVALAFFLVFVAAAMVFSWMWQPPDGDANALSLLAGFVMLFIKMAADAIGYQYNSSSGSEKKDEVSAKVNEVLATKVPSAAPPATPDPVVVMAWWSLMTDAERAAITAAAITDPKAAQFVATATTGKATPDDLAYLVGKGWLTQERAALIQAS